MTNIQTYFVCVPNTTSDNG